MTALIAALGANGQTLQLPKVEYASVLPILFLAGGALLLMLFSSVVRQRVSANLSALVTVAISAAVLASTQALWGDFAKEPYSVVAGALAADGFSLFFTVIIVSALLCSALISADWLTKREQHGPEYFVLMTLSATGAVIMAYANDLILIFLGLEVLSIALYVLVGLDRRNGSSREAAIKYFILGGFSSAIFLYGIALVYGATGSTNLSVIAAFLSQNVLLEYGLLMAGLVLLVVGFAFKVAAVPFHQWTPDVYQGAPTPVTGFMSAAAKAGAFAALIRVFDGTFFTLNKDWTPLILGLAVLTLLVGAIAACVQLNVKRMMAYSSISHAGFILLGLETANTQGASAALYYLLAYTFMVMGTFAVISAVGGQDDSRRGLEAFRGLGHRQPGLALAFTILLIAQAGVPLTSGFTAKFYVIGAQVAEGSYAVAVFAMLTAAIAAFFYLRIVIAMYTRDDESVDRIRLDITDSALSQGGGAAVITAPHLESDRRTTARIELGLASQITLTIALVFTVGMGVLPAGPDVNWMLDPINFARQGAAAIFPAAASPVSSIPSQ